MPCKKCIVCGNNVAEQKFHYFPRNPEKSKIWEQSMGIYSTWSSITRHNIICGKHFTADCYATVNQDQLNRNAVPTMYPCLPIIVPVDSFPHSFQPSLSVTPSSPNLPIIPIVPFSSLASTSSLKKNPLFKNIDTTSSTKKQALINVIKKKQNHLNKLKKLCNKRGHRIKDISNLDSSIFSNIFKGMPSTTVRFMISQMRCAKRLPRGRRWTLDEKILYLSLFKRSSRGYSLLRRVVALPSRSTLNALLTKVPFHAGLNEHIFQHLGKCLNAYKEEDRICSLTFDEMSLREHIQYNASTDTIEGVEDYGDECRSCKIANTASVFMVQGIYRKWKQPVAYYFSHGPMSSKKLELIIHNLLNALQRANLQVVATICDMGSVNVSTLRNMGSSVAHPFFIHSNRRIFTIFDPPHLLKCTRNLFSKYPIRFPTSLINNDEQIFEANWEDIKSAVEVDRRAPYIFRCLHKIKDEHLSPQSQQKMKVILAAQVLSRSVASYMYSLISQGNLPQKAIGTSTFVHLVDQLFDSFNGGSTICTNNLRSAITGKSAHHKFWTECLNTIPRWEFVGATRKPPSQMGWQITIAAFQGVWQELSEERNLPLLRSRSFNQDALENLFGAIRSGCGNNVNPTQTQFVSSLKTQIINGLAKQGLQGTNCEDDDVSLLSDLRSFFDVNQVCETITSNTVSTKITNESYSEKLSNIGNEIAQAVRIGNVGILSVAYVSGFIVKKVFKEHNCDLCQKVLTSDSTLPCNQFISFKEFSDDSSRLCYPSEPLVVAVGHGITLLENILPDILSAVGIRKKAAVCVIEEIDFSWINCVTHFEYIKDCIVTAICYIGIPWYCKRFVRERRAQTNFRSKKRKLNILNHQ